MKVNIILHEEFLQHQLVVNITESSKEKLEFIPDQVKEWIGYRLSDDSEGEFSSEQTCGYTGTWYIVPFNHNALLHVGFWRYNHYSDEALTKEDFNLTFGKIDGPHYFDKWINVYNRDLLEMVLYFRHESDTGQKFLNLFYTKLDKYIKRINHVK